MGRQVLSDRAVYALSLAVLAAVATVVALVGIFEEPINMVVIGGLKHASNPVLEFFGVVIWILAVICSAPTIFISPWIFLGIAVLLAIMAYRCYVTRPRQWALRPPRILRPPR